ncbi:MAG TPA: methyltransferase domain-containing protein, partial [Myxococcota bacterium]|nr:methyltransferase domain-containing protein [Myxococcota bacterium]
DLCIAALLVGEAGRAIGVDATPAMVAKARASAMLAGLGHIEVHEGDMARLPLADASADVLISNGSINLALDKAAVLGEAFRILRPGGRFQFADMVREDAGPGGCAAPQGGSWADCVSGTLAAGEVLAALRQAGFTEATLIALTPYRTSPSTTGAVFRAVRP